MVSTCMRTVADRFGLTLASECQEGEVIKGHQGQSSVIKGHPVYSPSSLPSAERERSIAEAPAKIESKMFLMREAIRGRHHMVPTG